MQTVEEAKKYLRANFDQVCKCPTCGQFVKLYKRKITSSMAYGLILLARHNKQDEFVHLLEFFKDIPFVTAGIAGDLPKLRWWGLLQQREGQKDDGNPNSGFYSLTANGILFVNSMIKVPKYLFLYNNSVQKRSEAMVGIKESLGMKFNYSELMGGK